MSESNGNKNIFRVRLTLFDVSRQAASDKDASIITRLVKDTVLDSPRHAQSFLLKPEEKASPEEVAAIQKNVLRFLRVKDKWSAIGSTLIKSQAFHRIHQSEDDDSSCPIVELPRTEYRKPYIPIANKDICVNCKEENYFPLSVSHQFPFVGAAVVENNTKSSPHLVGLDIVAFEDYNRKLYSSQDEFLDVFRESFTDREYECIKSNESSSLQKFYLRWAMKEAYTKALGVGLGFEFNSFDLCLSNIDDGERKCLVDTVLSAHDGIYFSGSVKFLTRPTKPSEVWDFYFLPLRDPTDSDLIAGCACVSAGPFPSPMKPPRFQVEVELTDIDSLIKWHHA